MSKLQEVEKDREAGVLQSMGSQSVGHPSPGDLPHPGIKPAFPALAGGFFTAEPPRKHRVVCGTFLTGGTRDQIRTSCSESTESNPWTTKEVLY